MIPIPQTELDTGVSCEILVRHRGAFECSTAAVVGVCEAAFDDIFARVGFNARRTVVVVSVEGDGVAATTELVAGGYAAGVAGGVTGGCGRVGEDVAVCNAVAAEALGTY